ncbi:cutinase transcription factor 1 beta [Colletotrichum incanum]|uniref:Cutinase transcription factor 1 beta n=1 Tax=Colletotrichum incanum TaxID=1573173 RepID=A0A162NJY0_COLIC|nr:cutinase transcription factor 1 beta [Colletotrichum incanum]
MYNSATNVSSKKSGSGSGRQRAARAAKACLSCRHRKVRCDVDKVNQPCTNCKLHSKNCLVVGRASRLATERRRLDRREIPSPEGVEVVTLQTAPSTFPREPSPRNLTSNLTHDDEVVGHPHNVYSDSESDKICEGLWGTYASDLPRRSATSLNQSSGSGREANGDSWSSRRARTGSHAAPTVIYSHLSFLTDGNLHRIPAEDVNYLESQGCLHVPVRPLLDDFVEQYYLHIHPLIPLIDEGEFWDMYSQTEREGASDNNMSLLLFQTMLFSSCTFVPFDTIKKLGFSTLRSARAAFYRRVKLLYDMDTESSLLTLAQSALLLIAWVPPSNLNQIPYKTWLGRAIQHAKSLNADRLATLAASPGDATTRHHKALRRLWWCCVSLDCVSPLCTRFNPYITRGSFNSEATKSLIISDLEDEIYRSNVYNPASKKRLIGLFEVYPDLTAALADLLTLVYPFEDSLWSRKWPSQEEDAQIQQCEAAMERWFIRASAQFPPVIETPQTNLDKRQELHKSVALHTNLMYMYYYHAKIAFYHYRILYYLHQDSDGSAQRDRQTAELKKSCNELQDAAAKMTQLLEELTRRRLVRWLPISAIACIAMPLALNVVSARLASVNGELSFESPIAAASNKSQLAVLKGAIKSFLPQYDGVELVKEAVKRAADMAQADTQFQPASAGPVITDWTHHLARNPSLYLKMTMAIDLSIRKGRIVEENDVPARLLSQMTPGQEVAPSGQPVSQSMPRSIRQLVGTRQERNLVYAHRLIATGTPTSGLAVESDHERRATPPLDPFDASWDNEHPIPEEMISEFSGLAERDSLVFPSVDDALATYFGGIADADTSYMLSSQDLMGWT